MASYLPMQKQRIQLDRRTYSVEVRQQVTQPPAAPRLLIPAYQPNATARDILRVCIQAIQRYTPEPHELWVIDNNSPWEYARWLQDWPRINVLFNRTEPLPPEGRSLWSRLRLRGHHNQMRWGSYANAAALELGRMIIDPQSHYLMTLHMDTLPCHIGWLSYLQSKLVDPVAAAGVAMDRRRTPEGVLHVLGYIVRYDLFRALNLDFWPQLPQYDVGDRVTVQLRATGYDVFACPNTQWEPHLIETIPEGSPFRHIDADRSFDDKGNVIFLHLWRGVPKASGLRRKKGGMSAEAWVRLAEEHLIG